MKRLFSMVFLCLSGIGMVFAQNDAQTVAMIELVRKEPITVRQLKEAIAPLEQAAGQTMTVAQRRQALDQLISQTLILQAAERDKMTVVNSELDNAVNSVKLQMAQQTGKMPTDAEFGAALQQQGTTLVALRGQLQKQILMEKYVQAKKQSQIQVNTNPTEAEIVKRYNYTKVRLVRPDTVSVTLIEVSQGTNKVGAKTIADRLVREVGNDPAKFDQVALRGQAGNLDYKTQAGIYVGMTLETLQQTGDQFMDIAFGLKQGEVSALIEGQGILNRGSMAYQLIKVTARYPFTAPLQLDDILDFSSPGTVRESIRQTIQAERMQTNYSNAAQELAADLRKERGAVTIYDQYLNW
jgi:parvulin-like peptidyl-prolyl isomerase